MTNANVATPTEGFNFQRTLRRAGAALIILAIGIDALDSAITPGGLEAADSTSGLVELGVVMSLAGYLFDKRDKQKQ